jgi:hypothetical protein
VKTAPASRRRRCHTTNRFVTQLTFFVIGRHTFTMGKLIAFPRAKVMPGRHPGRSLFQGFHELASLEHAELRLVGACTVGALLLMAALGLVLG